MDLNVPFFTLTLDSLLSLQIPVEEGTKGGLKAVRYTFPENMLDNGKYIEENKCFCRDGKYSTTHSDLF
jgi:hypothetical protein